MDQVAADYLSLYASTIEWPGGSSGVKVGPRCGREISGDLAAAPSLRPLRPRVSPTGSGPRLGGDSRRYAELPTPVFGLATDDAHRQVLLPWVVVPVYTVVNKAEESLGRRTGQLPARTFPEASTSRSHQRQASRPADRGIRKRLDLPAHRPRRAKQSRAAPHPWAAVPAGGHRRSRDRTLALHSSVAP